MLKDIFFPSSLTLFVKMEGSNLEAYWRLPLSVSKEFTIKMNRSLYLFGHFV